MSALAAPVFPSRSSLTPRDFDRIRKLAFDYCGLDIEPGKEELVASRLGKIMRKLNIATYSEYYDHVTGDKSEQALITMIDSLTTNHTSFFREQQHFDFLHATILPALANRQQIDVWSAACSSGEEPYTVAFSIRDYFNGGGPALKILATDISTRILEKAQKATYSMDHVKGIPMPTMQKYFLRGQGEWANHFKVKPEIRSSVQFRRLNLSEPLQNMQTQFPLILCRNVMIYFNARTQEELVDRLAQQLEPGGYLFIGHSESLNRIKHSLEYVRPAIYRRPGTLRPAGPPRRSAA
ncbi:chemotaxis protein methyltransferase CheR [Bryocella elongata]|uniref:protein-glutamate O-methyltransferase n=1 Tax=Bryocella elongata TaxID=863522 RepID=A0A1H5TGR5_9BACT|nr:protein-glutamate O-methyltransferase CheR [Bryocella elongata]SEF62015.1 chemotaxis protein methyltransferase CheR [Bryocella elongata]